MGSAYQYQLAIVVTTTLGLLLRFLLNPLRRIPGPPLYALTSWRLAYDDLKGHTTRRIHSLHESYGPVVRIGPNWVSFNSLEALKTIYGAGSRSQRTSFYKLFEPYGKPTMFTMAGVEEHRGRKRMLAKPYAKTNVVKGWMAGAIEGRVSNFMQLLDGGQSRERCEMGPLLGFYSLDVATAFVYGKTYSTNALIGVEKHAALLDDYKNPFRRQLSWHGVHGESRLKTVLLGSLCSVPQEHNSQPFSRIRRFAMEVFECQKVDKNAIFEDELPLVKQLKEANKATDSASLSDMDIVSECADHLLAGIETTRNLLLFLVWALSTPRNRSCQERLREEVASLDAVDLNSNGIPSVEAVDKLPYLNAILTEALRLYAPLPASQPRSFESDTVVAGYHIPARTIVSMSPYCLHHNPDVFPSPNEFRPERWLDDGAQELLKWWWPFSSGGRMCTGMHLAMAEISTLVAAIYRQYSTTIPEGLQDVSPAITSRFEIFWDDTCSRYEEDSCIIKLTEV